MTFEQIGQQLKTARDSLGLSLNQIQERTKIPYAHLHAIDNGLPEELPEPVYVTGFIKRYAECVGLDGQRLAEQYKQVLEGDDHSNGKFQLFTKPVAKASSHLAAAPAPVYNRSTRLPRHAPNPLKTLPFYVVWVIVVLSLVAYLARQQSNDAGQQDPSVLSLRQSAEKLGNLPGTNSNSLLPPTKEADSTDHDARVALTASQHVWVEVKSVSSGETCFAGILERGDRKDFHDPQGLRVHASNGASLTVEQDGKSQTLGSTGKIAEKAFMAQDSQGRITEPEAVVEKKAATAKPIAQSPTSVRKPTVPKKTASTASKAMSSFEGAGSHRQLPGESVNGTQNIDVPYRY
jgi:cytoskeletal protein RodZ